MGDWNVFQRSAALTALRGVLVLLAGLFAIFFPDMALAALVVVGGALLLVDGVLGVWSLTFGNAKSGNYWFDVVRNVLAIILGVLILFSPWIATVIAVIYIVYMLAIAAIFVGAMEIWVVHREREFYAKVWPVYLNGALAILFGLLLVFWPLAGASLMVILGGVLMVLFSFGLFGVARRLWQAGK